MPDWDGMIKAKSAAADDLLKRPDVTGVGVGYREKGEQVTDEPAIRVYVEHKRPLNEVPAEARIPTEIGGFKTDVIEKGHEVLAQITPARPGTNPYVEALLHEEVPGVQLEQSPLVGGIQIWVTRKNLLSSLGSICCFVRQSLKTGPNSYKDGGVHLLTAAHVLDPKEGAIDDKVYQPQPIEVRAGKSDISWLRDAGLARPGIGVTWRNDIYGVGAIGGIADPEQDQVVRKQGRTTGLTVGKVLDISFNYKNQNLDKTFTDLFKIIPLTDDYSFVKEGDSGGPVFTGGEDIGDNPAVLLGLVHSEAVGARKTAATSAATASGATLTFEAGVPEGINNGQLVRDLTNPGVIPTGTTVKESSTTTVTLSANVTAGGVASGDTIRFSATHATASKIRNIFLKWNNDTIGESNTLMLAGRSGRGDLSLDLSQPMSLNYVGPTGHRGYSPYGVPRFEARLDGLFAFGSKVQGKWSATGGSGGPYTFAVEPALPEGLSLSPNGDFSGSTNAPETGLPPFVGYWKAWVGNVTATDNGGHKSAPVMWRSRMILPFTLSYTGTGDVHQGAAVSGHWKATGGGYGITYTFAVEPALPEGLSLSPNGDFSGSTNTAPFHYIGSVTATDADGYRSAPVRWEFYITLPPPVPKIGVNPLRNADKRNC